MPQPPLKRGDRVAINTSSLQAHAQLSALGLGPFSVERTVGDNVIIQTQQGLFTISRAAVIKVR